MLFFVIYIPLLLSYSSHIFTGMYSGGIFETVFALLEILCVSTRYEFERSCRIFRVFLKLFLWVTFEKPNIDVS